MHGTGRHARWARPAPLLVLLLVACSPEGTHPPTGATATSHEHPGAPMTGEHARTFVVRGATVLRTPGDTAVRDLFVAQGRVVEALTAPDPHVVDAAGASVVPLVVDSTAAARPGPRRPAHELVPGDEASFAVVRRPVGELAGRTVLMVTPSDLTAVFVAGHLEVWQGEPTRPAGADVSDPATSATWVGTWQDTGRGLQQHLLPDGRYSETRGGRVDAYTGRYWVREDRITYLDDSGFWAFGELVDGVLHHAGLVMTAVAPDPARGG